MWSESVEAGEGCYGGFVVGNATGFDGRVHGPNGIAHIDASDIHLSGQDIAES